MNILTMKRLRGIIDQFPDAREQLLDWYKVVKPSTYNHLTEVRAMFPTADAVGDKKELTCFYIKGNHYRLIVRIFYPHRVYIKDFLNHADYTKKYVKKRGGK